MSNWKKNLIALDYCLWQSADRFALRFVPAAPAWLVS